jgi:gluconolactonase
MAWFHSALNFLSGLFQRFQPSKNSDWAWLYIFFPFLLVYLLLMINFMNQSSYYSPDGNEDLFEIFNHSLFKKLISPNEKIEIVAKDFQWAEGPVWISNTENPMDRDGYLLVSDTVTNQIWKYERGNGLFVVGKVLYIQNSGCHRNQQEWCDKILEPGSNGLKNLGTISKDLIVCQHGNRRIGITYTNGSFVTIASHHEGKRLNSPNDAVISYDKRLYFTDPPYGLYGKEIGEVLEKELPINGIYMVDTEDLLSVLSTGVATKNTILVDDQLTRPNGIALSPGSTRLYVSNSDRKYPVWKVYDVNPETGRLENGRIFYNSEHLYPEGEMKVGNPDGFKIDMNGNLFASGPGGVLVISPDGELLGRIRINPKVSNVAFGGDGFLYITATDQVMRIRVLTKPLLPVTVVE